MLWFYKALKQGINAISILPYFDIPNGYPGKIAPELGNAQHMSSFSEDFYPV
jgi:hypothetical protein